MGSKAMVRELCGAADLDQSILNDILVVKQVHFRQPVGYALRIKGNVLS